MSDCWTTLSGTRIGSVHVRDDMPLQDAVLTWADGDRAVLAVADGHGHSAHFRSDTGARLAVASAVEELRRRLPDVAAAPDEAAAVKVATEAGTAVVESWTAGVRDDIATRPYDVPVGDSLLPYGTTVLAAAAAGGHTVFLQIGDGDTVLVDAAGVARRPLPEDPELDGPFTTSLCQPDPLSALRVAAADSADVALVFLCTDGFGRPQADSGWWRQTGEQLMTFGRERGWAWVGEQLDGWLDEPAQVGGDDTTMAIMARAEAQ